MDIRNVAIIAHVDHGKTSLVDALLRQSLTKMNKEVAATEFIMDSNELERERGITIFSKNASVNWQGTKINIIDTPGHADFGGEVERVLKMADGCLLLVDAKEGPMPQTRFVLKKALESNLWVVVVVNKIDKPDARPNYVVDKTLDLFMELGAEEHIANFPIVYASAKLGKAGLGRDLDAMKDISPIFDAILEYVPAPQGDPTKPLQILINTLTADSFKGRIATGRIYNGTIRAGQEIVHINRLGEAKKCRLVSLMTYEGLSRMDAKEVSAGDIVAISGIPDITIGETVADPENPMALPLLNIEEPTVKMTFLVNNSPVAGREGEFTTSRQIRERLYRELESDVALRMEDVVTMANGKGGWVVSGRGELHLAILIERMRREGYEFQVSRPQVINKTINGKTCTPYDDVSIEVPEAHSGSVIQKMGSRKGELADMRTENGTTYLDFSIPTRGMFGYRQEFITDTKGLGIMHVVFDEYRPDPGNWKEREQGSLVAHETGITRLYGMLNVQDQGIFFIGPGEQVYRGQVVGQRSRPQDLRVNVCKEKELSNMRSKNQGIDDHFDQPHRMDLEDALEYIGDDELVEITPKSVRIRKMILDEMEERRRQLGIKS
ncbi:MAG: translational GTPase TypA [Candidatus Liptonbacteria bacterium]